MHELSHSAPARHRPVMLDEVLVALAPKPGEIYLDGTFGAGGYTKALLDSADCKVIAIDRDPTAIANGQVLVTESNGRLTLLQGTFARMVELVRTLGIEHVDGVVLDVGVSSMQLDEAERGFSFMRDGPLDMRMSLNGPTAADQVNTLEHYELSRVIFVLGDEPRAKAIARAIIKARTEAPLRTTFDLVQAIEKATGPQRAKDRTHPATRTFQALRILVNSELHELAEALCAAERLLREGGRLVVVAFHSLEDRIVKRFFTLRTGREAAPSRHHPLAVREHAPSFVQTEKGAVEPGDAEIESNPRARSAKMRCAVRTAASAWPEDLAQLGLPVIPQGLRA
jgi:16S rRNA (cytosine1402-N4)-methyltransferase